MDLIKLRNLLEECIKIEQGNYLGGSFSVDLAEAQEELDQAEQLLEQRAGNAKRTLAIKFADALLKDFEMSEFENGTLCWKLCGAPNKMTTIEVYDRYIDEILANDNMNSEIMDMKNTLIKPMRVQRSRKKGFNLQEASRSGLPVKYVGRPTKWGNPLKLIGDAIYIDASHRRKILNPWVLYGHGNDIKDLIYLYIKLWDGIEFSNTDLQYWSDKFKELDLTELKGKDLACFCPLVNKKGEYAPCHADVLLSLSNNISLKNVINESKTL